MTTPKLRVLIVAANYADARFAANVLEEHGDEARISDDVTDALGHLARTAFDVAMVSLSLPRGDGLALVHHIRALHPQVDVIVMSAPSEIEETAHAIALGVLQSVVLPLTGDAILVAADRARERRILVAERARLAAQEAASRRRTATYARCAAFVAETDILHVARLVLDACSGEIDLVGAAVYVASPTGVGFFQAAAIGKSDGLPIEIDDRELATVDPTMTVSEEDGRVRIALIGDADIVGLIEILPKATPIPAFAREGLEIVAGLGTAALVAARKVDAIARTGIKDPETSAYTFAYFGEVAGREIDRAARFGRRFALLTMSLPNLEDVRQRVPGREFVELRRLVTDAVLEAVKDSDVVARVEDDEYYVLLPETALLGALATRRRIRAKVGTLVELAQIGGIDVIEPIVGIATYPADGLDLGRLLRTSRRRADRSRRGVYRRLRLYELSFWDIVDALLGERGAIRLTQDGHLDLPPPLLRAQDELSLSRHTHMPTSLVVRLAEQLTHDAVRFRAPGAIYVAGDDVLADAVAQAMDVPDPGALRAWVLGGSSEVSARIRLPAPDPRLARQTLFLSMTDLGGYAFLGREVAPGITAAFHSSDLDLVDGLVTAFQAAYRLQPEVGE